MRERGSGTVTKLGEGRYWARAPLENGKRKPLGVWPTEEAAERRIQAHADAADDKQPTNERTPVKAGRSDRQTANERKLEQHLDGWRRAREIRAYIDDIRQLFEDWDYQPPQNSPLMQWLEWCEGEAVDADPIEQIGGQVVSASLAAHGGKVTIQPLGRRVRVIRAGESSEHAPGPPVTRRRKARV